MKRIGIIVMAMVTAMVTASSAQICEYAGTSLPYPYHGDREAYQVPDSLEVVYVDHVGRHGARFLSKASYTQDMLKFLDSEGPLTAAGVKLRALCHRLDSVTAGHYGALDSIGMVEQTGIGDRMSRRGAEALRQLDSVTAIASYVPRCVMSMDICSHAVIWNHPKTEMGQGSGPRYNQLVRFFDTDSAYIAYDRSNEWKRVWEKYDAKVSPVNAVRRLIPDGNAVSDKKLRKMARVMYKIVSGANAVFGDVDWRAFYTPQEYRRAWQSENLRHYLTYSANGLSLTPSRMSCSLVADIAKSLERASRPGYDGPAMTLRFGHAETLMPLLSQLAVPGCRYVTTDWNRVAEHWHDYEVVPMAANLQLLLLRSKGSDRMYVQTLHNEQPAMPLMTYRQAQEWLDQSLTR